MSSEVVRAFEDSHGLLLQGDVRACLAAMEPESVQCVVTSPPYWGLRSYSTDPQIWGGSPDCDHGETVPSPPPNVPRAGNAPDRPSGFQQQRGAASQGASPAWQPTPGLPPMTGGSGPASAQPGTNAGSQFGNAWVEIAAQPKNGNTDATYADKQASNNGALRIVPSSATCTRCGAWRGELGSEPTVEQFIANLVEVFAAVRRVLRDDGTLWINLGSSMAGSGKGPTGHNGIGNAETRQGFHSPGATRLTGWKPKDLIQTPFLLFEALRQDGWWLRSVAPWIKRSGMPESCTDRPTHSLEWIGLFSKSERYFYDAEAARIAPVSKPQRYLAPHYRQRGDYQQNGVIEPRTEPAVDAPPGGRNRRNTDWYFDGLDAEIAATEADLRALRDLRAQGGVRLGDDGLPLAFDVNPQGFAGAHFATWPPNLGKPMIALSTSERGACAACGAPWARVTRRASAPPEVFTNRAAPEDGFVHSGSGVNGEMRGHGAKLQAWRDEHPTETTGWAPTCTCECPDTRPCVVLDCFAGSSTSLLVARSLGRFGLGCELQPDYVAMSLKRLRQGVLL